MSRVTIAVCVLAAAVVLLPDMAYAQASKGLPMPCLQVADEKAVRAVLGDGFTLASASMSKPGQSSCSWTDGADKPRRLSVGVVDKRGFPTSTPTPAGAFDLAIAAYTKAGLKGEPVAGLGDQATQFTLGEARILLIRRADAVMSVSATNLPGDLVTAVAKRALSAPPPALGDHATFPEPEPIVAAKPMDVPRAQQNLPCVRALTSADLRSLKRTDVLVEIMHPRPGYSACEWRTTTAGENGFSVAVATREEFADARMANAAAYFAAERKTMESFGPSWTPLSGVGAEAVVAIGSGPAIMARTASEVITIKCFDCSRDQIVAMTRVAIGKLVREPTPDKPPVAKGVSLPCLQILDAKAVKAALGQDLEVAAAPVRAGWSHCAWFAGGGGMKQVFLLEFLDQRVFLNKALFSTAAPTAPDIFDYEVGTRRRGGIQAEPLGALGLRAVAFGMDKITELFVLRSDGVIRLLSELSRQQLRAIADRAATARSPLLGHHVASPDPGTVSPAQPAALDDSTRNLPCVQMLTEAELRRANRMDVLVDAVGNRPGYSLCEWRTTTQIGTGFIVSVANADEFKALRLPGASAYFSAERRGMAATLKLEPLYGLGKEAVQAEGPGQAVVMVRTEGEHVVTVNCFNCSVFDAIVIARVAAVVK